MRDRLLIGTGFVVLAYIAVVLVCTWVYKKAGKSSLEALYYSVDTIVCRGRMVDFEDDTPQKRRGRVVASIESVFGHLALPILVGLLFSSLWMDNDWFPP